MSAMFVEKILSRPTEIEMKVGAVSIDTVHACNSGSWQLGSVYYVLTPE
jgi:hypothetical protein